MRGARRLTLLALASALAACGSPRPAANRSPAGAKVFARDCALCHSVIGDESLHRQGGDLLGYRITRQQLLEYTREMPVRHRLTRADLNAVVDYVFALQSRGSAR